MEVKGAKKDIIIIRKIKTINTFTKIQILI